jgi:hypothetical protein
MIFDLFFFLCVAAGVITGLWKGLAWQLAGIGSVVLGFIAGLPLSGAIAASLQNPTVFKRFLVFAVCYACISLVCYAAALVLRTRLEAVKLERYDRHMGGFVGLIHGLALCATITMFLVTLSEGARKAILPRPTGKVIGVTLDAMHGVLPEGLHEMLHPYMHPEPEAKPAPAPAHPAPAPAPAPSTNSHDGHHHSFEVGGIPSRRRLLSASLP